MRIVAKEGRVFDPSRPYDVVVVGGGVAGLCAVIAARRSGASALMLEQSSRASRGGATRHARNLRVMHDAPNKSIPRTYSADEFWRDLVEVTGAHTDETLARLLIGKSAEVTDFMARCGVCIQKPREHDPSRKTAYLLGGGKAMLNALHLTTERLGVDILYDAEAPTLPLDDGRARELPLLVGGVSTRVGAKTVVVASGGHSANIEWLKRYWGDAADHFMIRGAADAQGQILASLLAQDVAPVGTPGECHMVAVDARGPKFDGGIVTRLDGVPFGIVVDANGRRFHDEGASVGPRRYAIWGDLVARRPNPIAFAICDADAEARFRPSIYPPIRAQTIAELAGKLGLDPATLVATVEAFNQGVRPLTDDPAPWRTEGVVPAKTRWALPLKTPPFNAYPMRPGVTFSYLGVKVDESARVLLNNGRPARNVFAAGSIMAANVIGKGYLAGIGITIGAVFGAIAGREAARHANL